MESMVSIAIVMIVFSLSSIVIINITSSGMSGEKQNAYMLTKVLRNETITQSRYIDETVEIDGLTLEKTIVDYKGSNTLKLLLIVTSNEQKKLFESRELILISEKL